MAPPNRMPSGNYRSRSSSPEERAAGFADHQRQLKEEAAERRKVAADSPAPKGRAPRKPSMPRRAD